MTQMIDSTVDYRAVHCFSDCAMQTLEVEKAQLPAFESFLFQITSTMVEFFYFSDNKKKNK